VLTTCPFNKPLILHPETIRDLGDLLSDYVRQNFKDWYFKTKGMYIGNGLLEQTVSGANNHKSSDASF
jgi:hypothetical protein